MKNNKNLEIEISNDDTSSIIDLKNRFNNLEIPSKKNTSPLSNDSKETFDISSDIDFLNDSSKEIKNYIANNETNKLFKIIESIDNEVVTIINDDKDMSQKVEKFTELGEKVIGTKIAKRMAIQFINIIRNPEFRDTTVGQEIYIGYRNLLDNLNFNTINIQEGITIKSDIIKNTYYYLLIACDLDAITSIQEFCNEVNSVISGTSTNVVRSIENISKIEEIVETSKNDMEETRKETNEKVDKIIEQNKSNYKAIMSLIYTGIKMMCGNPIGMVIFSTGGVMTATYIGNIAINEAIKMSTGNYFSDRKPIVIKDEKIDKTEIMEISNNDDKKVSEAFNTLIEAVKEYINDFWK